MEQQRALLLVLGALMIAAVGQGGAALAGESEPTPAPAGCRDHFIGWYALPAHRDPHRKSTGPAAPASRPTDDAAENVAAFIPVYKRGGTYYWVCRGVEVPLIECPNGLEWGLKPSSMEGTKITFDETSKTYTMTIVDSGDATFNENSTSGMPRNVRKVDAPVGWCDPTAARPNTNDDFIGWYLLAWFPGYRYEIRREGDAYVATGQILHGSGWTPDQERLQLAPLSDRQGFVLIEHRGTTTSIIYSPEASRFELELRRTGKYTLRMPLVRIPAPVPFDAVPTSQPDRWIWIGIPSYKG